MGGDAQVIAPGQLDRRYLDPSYWWSADRPRLVADSIYLWGRLSAGIPGDRDPAGGLWLCQCAQLESAFASGSGAAKISACGVWGCRRGGADPDLSAPSLWQLFDGLGDRFRLPGGFHPLDGLARADADPAGRGSRVNIVAIAGATIPSDTANSLQVMKACQALVQIGHHVTLLVPGVRNTSTDLQQHYGLQTDFPIEWLSSSSRRRFTWDSVQRARTLQADVIYSWFPQSATFALLYKISTVFE